MASLVLSGDTSGSITVSAPAVSGSNTQTLVATTGTLAPIVSGTAVTASGSSVDFTSIPSWVKRITVMLVGVSTAAAGTVRIRIGSSSGLVTTGYAGGAMSNTTAPANGAVNLGSSPEGIGGFTTTDGTTLVYGSFVVTNVTGNTWVASGMLYRLNDSIAAYSNGSIALSGILDRISVVATTSTFDAGTINILYE